MTRSTPEMQSPFSENALKAIFKVRAGNPSVIMSRENNRLEFRETFSMNACRDKLRTFAAFANNQGGYLLFGVKDRPRRLIGLSGTNFADLQTEKLTGMLNEHFSPEIHWEAHEYEFDGLVFGLLYIHEAHTKPVVCLKYCEQAKCKEGDIYYRYRGRSEAIKYPELRALLDDIRNRERDLWMKHLNRIASVGVHNAAVMDSLTGEVAGSAGSFLIDESLLPKLSFIREGHFAENPAAPALKLVGDVEVIDSHLIQPTKQIVRRTRGINSPDIVNAFLDQEDVSDPAEYISALCYQTASTWPVYYFMVKAGMTAEDVIAIIDNSKSTSAARHSLRRRIGGPPSARALGADNSEVAECRRRVLARALNGELDVDAFRDTLVAVTTLSADEIDKDYLFPRLKTWFEDKYSEMDGNKKGLFRGVLVYLDTVLYAHQISESS